MTKRDKPHKEMIKAKKKQKKLIKPESYKNTRIKYLN